MINKLVLLIDDEETDLLLQTLQPEIPDVRIVSVSTLVDLMNEVDHNSRLLSFGSSLIVPGEILRRLSYPAYNLHPGPPEYPGRYPSVFAIYHEEREFGTTLHEMAPRVDEGAILAVHRFPIKPDGGRLDLDIDSYMSALGVMKHFAKDFVEPKGLKPNGAQWSGRKWRKADFEALCKLPTDIDQAEFERRYRAIGEGPNHHLEITIFGQRFILDNQRDEPVVKAGNPIEEKN